MTLALVLNVLAIFLMMTPGFVLRRRGALSEGGTADLARLSVAAIYPCLIFTVIVGSFSLPELEHSWPLPLAVFSLMVLGYAVGRLVCPWIRFRDAEESHAFLFQCSFNNYSFLPLPLVAVLFGHKAVGALILSSLGAELAVWTLGLYILEGNQLRWRNLRHLLSPPLLALVAGVLAVVARDTGALGAIPGYYGALQTPKGILLHAVQMVGAATIPLAMVVAGSSIAMLPFTELRSSRVWLVSALRLLAIPALALTLLWCLPFPREQREVLAVVAVMPTSLASIALTRVYGGDEHFTAGTVLLTHLLALATVPLVLAFFLARCG